MKQLKVNLGTIAANADQIFHRLRWAMELLDRLMQLFTCFEVTS